MGGEAQPAGGPDLAQGVAVEELADDAILSGHVGDDSVLLVRHRGAFHAVDAACTHYGVPLDGGIVHDGSIRCPVHHSRFDLVTGDAVAAPALRPLGCWEVEVSGGRVRVTGRRESSRAAPRAAAPPSAIPERVVIVGAGAAGTACAEMLRRLGYPGSVTLLEAGPDAPYDRPNLSKDYLAGNAPEEWLPLLPDDFFRANRIQLELRARVVGIDTAGRRVRLMDGRHVDYDALVLATGAEPLRLPFNARVGPPLLYLRTLGDSRAVIAAAEGKRRAVVVGSSFIGLEAAASLRARGLEVTVVSHDQLPLGHLLGPQLGGALQSLHEQHGVAFRLADAVAALDAEGVRLKSGGHLAADLVVVGIGVRPGLALAAWARLEVDNNGVLVDEQLRTSDPAIWAAGDICRWLDPWSGERIRSEHWVVAQRQGQTIARNLLGAGERFNAAPFFWSAHYDVVVSYVGHAERWDAIELDGDPAGHDCTAVYRRGGRVLAVATVARDQTSLRAEAAIEAHDPARLEAVLRG